MFFFFFLYNENLDPIDFHCVDKKKKIFKKFHRRKESHTGLNSKTIFLGEQSH